MPYTLTVVSREPALVRRHGRDSALGGAPSVGAGASTATRPTVQVGGTDIVVVSSAGAEVVIDVKRVRRRRIVWLDVNSPAHAWAVHNKRARTITVVVATLPGMSDFMAALPDDLSLADVCMPGTHDSCALYGFPISQCQQPSTPIERQLADGIRFLDVRLRVIGDVLHMYHGVRPQRLTFPLLLRTLAAFLAAHPAEAVLVSLKEEDDAHPLFAAHVARDLAAHPPAAGWFLDERVPRLGEVRGRAMLLTRFDAPGGDTEWVGRRGLHPTRWPDSRPEGFEWECAGTTVRTQDWYRVQTFLRIPEKAAILRAHLAGARPGALTLSYASAADFPLATPTWIAKGVGWPRWGLGVWGVNDRLAGWLVGELARRGDGSVDEWGDGDEDDGGGGDKAKVGGTRGGMVVPLDFYRQSEAGSVAELVVALNFV